MEVVSMSPAWEGEEIRLAIFRELDKKSLGTTMRVCRDWLHTGIPQLWHTLIPDALRRVAPDRQHLYRSAIDTLDLTSVNHLRVDIHGWTFPKVSQLSVHPAIMAKPPVFCSLLGRCGSSLLAVSDTAPSAGAVGLITIKNFAPSDPSVEKFEVHRIVLQHLASRLGLEQLILWSAVIPRNAIPPADPTKLPAPFARLTTVVARIAAADAPALMALLATPAPSRSLTFLTLEVNVAGAKSAVRQRALDAIVHALPQLQVLQLSYHPPRIPVEAHQRPPSPAADSGGAPTAGPPDLGFFLTSVDDLVSDDFGALGGLHELDILHVQGAIYVPEAGGWRALVSGLPKLLSLTLDCFCSLPPGALAAAGQHCRALRHLNLAAINSYEAVVEAVGGAMATQPPGSVLFPEMSDLWVLGPVLDLAQ